ncbi:NADH:flavin oxidoreductase [Neokomagataea thailandica NBRC 106555]|uniref:Alkene reductase n=2 Tax=Neokomagataea TaxID=1223423 RepID=A0A4Y6VAR3_9PROT|nr:MULTISPECIES: alkene reductase [Neokomagataea]QDH25661.1 alkene reductase [Neokomagataea tanensis]GBR55358.1 NADH:flavin oxidoreductase [Neokomagataea thailandica NBRC 106555]
MKNSVLFDSVTLGPYTLRNRIVLPPLTRSRSSQPGNIPNDLMATYYSQRSSAGFMVTEGTQIEPRGQGYAWTPGIYSPEQIVGWRKITDAVHEKKGTIFLQLWHVGRVSHASLQPGGAAPIAPSAIPADNVRVFVETGPGQGALTQPSAPRALTTAEVKELVQLYAKAARNALDAGFDGVEIHSANGYLLNQFISAHTNQRDDEYGGSLENRLRFLAEVTQAVADVVGKERMGVRFSPLFATTDEDRVYLGLVEEDPHTTYIEAIKTLEKVGVAYVSIAEADWDNAPDLPESFRADIRKNFSGRVLYAGRYTPERGVSVIEAGWGDMIAFGRPFIANPDLPERIAHGWSLNPVDPKTMYGGTAKGYADYPAYQR